MKNLKIIFELLKQVVNYKNIEKEMVSRGEDWSSWKSHFPVSLSPHTEIKNFGTESMLESEK